MLPLTRVTTIRAFAPVEDEAEIAAWLEDALADEESVDAVVATGLALLNRALHAQAVTVADPLGHELAAERAAAVRLGYGSGEEVAEGASTVTMEVDVRTGASRRQVREASLRPQERVTAVLRGREGFDACEPLLLRARADLDAGRAREAALQLRVGFEALLVELDGAIEEPEHDEDMATLRERRAEVGEAANDALRGELSAETSARVGELLDICERILRRRRVLRG